MQLRSLVNLLVEKRLHEIFGTCRTDTSECLERGIYPFPTTGDKEPSTTFNIFSTRTMGIRNIQIIMTCHMICSSRIYDPMITRKANDIESSRKGI